MGSKSIADRLRWNAKTSEIAARSPLLDGEPGFRASLEQDNALLSEAAAALDTLEAIVREMVSKPPVGPYKTKLANIAAALDELDREQGLEPGGEMQDDIRRWEADIRAATRRGD